MPEINLIVANFLRQIAGSDWSKKGLAALADAVEAGERKVSFDPDYQPDGGPTARGSSGDADSGATHG